MLPNQGRTEIYLPALPALVRIATAFPPLVDDIVGFLVQLGHVCLSQSCMHGAYDHRIVSSMLRQLDRDMVTEEETVEKTVIKKEEKEATPIAPQTIKIEPMEVDIKKEREEGELEDGELPDTKSVQIRKTPIAIRADNQHEHGKPQNLSTDLSIPFSQAQIRELFKLLPESSLMGAEVSRTFAELCNKAVLCKSIY